MIVITWNVQWCLGCDGNVDPACVIRVARELADFDVLCLQEVARNFPELRGSRGEDQFSLLAAELPGYTLIEGIATDRLGSTGGRSQFGNAILTRLPVLQVFRHLLPWPADLTVPTMQRVALEAVIVNKNQELRITTTHLEYYSLSQRMAQVGRLRGLQAEASAHVADFKGKSRNSGPFSPAQRPGTGILTGDFNFCPTDPEYLILQMPIAGARGYRDAWKNKYGDKLHSPTVGVHDRHQWPHGPSCFDLILVTEDLSERVKDVVVDSISDASDHQPVILYLGAQQGTH